MLEDIEFIYKCTNAIFFDNSIGIRMKNKLKNDKEESVEKIAADQNLIDDRIIKKKDEKISNEDDGE